MRAIPGTITIAVACAAGTIAAAAGPYQVAEVSPLAGQTQSRAYGINNLGAVVGRSSNYDAGQGKAVDRTAIVRSPAGTVQALPTLSGESGAWEIDDSGRASGFAFNASSQQRAVRWNTANSTILDLGTLVNPNSQAGETSTAYGVSSQGVVVGESDIPNDAGDFVASHAVVRTLAGSLLDLGTLDSSHPEYEHGYSIAYAANTSGNVVGIASQTATGPWLFRPFIWNAASGMQELPIDATHSTGEWYATTINDAGVITGHVIPVGGQSTPYYWTSSSALPTALPMPASHPHGEIYGMSSGGVMVGMMWNDAGDERAFVFQPGSAVQDLNDLIGSGLGWTLEFARDVNDAGQIVGTGTHNGAVRGFILAPITVLPEISIQDMSVEEGSSGSTTATFTVTLTQP